LLRIHLRILGSLSLGNYRSRAPLAYYSDLYNPRECPHLLYLDLQSIRSFIPTLILFVQPTPYSSRDVQLKSEQFIDTVEDIVANVAKEAKYNIRRANESEQLQPPRSSFSSASDMVVLTSTLLSPNLKSEI
jgi:hypothetical protein